MIHELARELTRARTALAAALVTTRSATTPSSLGFTPYIPASSSSPISPVTPPSSTGVSAVILSVLLPSGFHFSLLL